MILSIVISIINVKREKGKRKFIKSRQRNLITTMNGWNTINLDADLYEYLECLSYKQEIDPNIAKLLFVEPI